MTFRLPGDVRSAEEASRKLTLTEKLVLLYAASIPFSGLAIAGRSLTFLVGAVYLAVAITIRLKSERRGEKENLPIGRVLPAAVFVFWCATSYYWSLAPDLTIGTATTLLILLVTSSFLARDISRVSKQIPLAIVIGAVPASIIVLGATASTADRRTANGNANDVALTLLLAVVCALWLVLEGRSRARRLGATSLVILIPGVVATGSRMAVVGAAASLLGVLIWLVVKRKWRSMFLFSVLFAVGGAVFLFLPPSLIPSRLFGIQDSMSTDSLGGRVYLWNAILERGFDMTGVGAGASQAYLGEAIGFNNVSHNVFLGIFLEMGIVGLLLFLLILLNAIFAARRSPFSGLLFFILPVMVVGSMTLSMEASRPLWFVLALAWAVQPHKPTSPPGPGSSQPQSSLGRATHAQTSLSRGRVVVETQASAS